MDHNNYNHTSSAVRIFAFSSPSPTAPPPPLASSSSSSSSESPRAAAAATSSGSVLPNEILDAIFEHLPRDALARAARVSQRWRANAERLLYAAILIHEVLPRASPWPWPWPLPNKEEEGDDDDDDDEGEGEEEEEATQTQTQMQTQVRTMMIPAVPAATLRCCETLSARPHLAAYVRRFHVRWETDAVESPLFLLPIAHNIARTLVPTLVHLDSLELSFGLAPHLPALHPPPPAAPSQLPVDPPPPPFPQQSQSQSQHQPPYHNAQYHHHHYHHHPHRLHLLSPFRLSSLRTLALYGIGEPPEPELEHMLRSHPSLQHLRLSDYGRALRLLPADVPHLRSFRGCPATAASILPGRPVQSLGLVGGHRRRGTAYDDAADASEDDLARIARGSLPVRELDLSGLGVTPALLRSVSRHLNHVEWLKVRLALRHTLHYAPSGIVSPRQILLLLLSFRFSLSLFPFGTWKFPFCQTTRACIRNQKKKKS